MNTYAYGHDYGNSDTCSALIFNDQHLHRRIPSFTASGDYESFTRNIGKPKDGEYIYSNASTELYVGKLALEQSVSPESTMDDIYRYTSPQSLYLLLTSAASLLPNENEFSLHVVTGLPVETHQKNPELRKAIPKFLESGSPHRFKFNGVDKTIHITTPGIVLIEGSAALAEYGKKGNYTKAVADIGGRTTDLYVVRGQRAMLEACRHTVAGVQKAMEHFNTQFEKRYGRALDQFELSRALNTYIAPRKHEISITVDGHAVLVRDMVEQSMLHMGRLIASFIAKKWSGGDETGKVASNYDDVLLIGGGVHFFGDMIRARIPQARTIEKVAPEMANATSYALTAQRLLSRKSVDSKVS